MPVKKKTKPQTLLIESIVEAITDKKGKDPVILNFAKLSGTVCDAFIICHGSSRTHTEALARNVDEVVKKNTGQDPWHKEGLENAEWILIDYGDIVVHIFQEERRKFYNIEQLWADAETIKVDVTE